MKEKWARIYDHIAFNKGCTLKDCNKRVLFDMALRSLYGHIDHIRFTKLAVQIINAGEGQFVCNLAKFLRKETSIENIPSVLVCLLARTDMGRKYVKEAGEVVVKRPYDVIRIVTLYVKSFELELPAELKKVLQDKVRQFSEFEFMYDNKKFYYGFTLQEVFKILDVSPKSKRQKVLFDKILKGSLKSVAKWNNPFSLKNLTGETWVKKLNRPIDYLTVVKNIENIMEKSPKSESDLIDMLLFDLSMLNSKTSPVDLYLAYNKLKDNEKYKDILTILSRNVEICVDNMKRFKGRTLIALGGGWWKEKVKDNSNTSCGTIARILSVVFSKICQNSTFVTFEDDAVESKFDDNYFKNADDLHLPKFWDQLSPFNFLNETRKHFNRVIIISTDSYRFRDFNGLKHCLQNLRKNGITIPPDKYIHVLNIKNYGEPNVNSVGKVDLFSGWHTCFFEWMRLFEMDFDDIFDKLRGANNE